MTSPHSPGRSTTGWRESASDCSDHAACARRSLWMTTRSCSAPHLRIDAADRSAAAASSRAPVEAPPSSSSKTGLRVDGAVSRLYDAGPEEPVNQRAQSEGNAAARRWPAGSTVMLFTLKYESRELRAVYSVCRFRAFLSRLGEPFDDRRGLIFKGNLCAVLAFLGGMTSFQPPKPSPSRLKWHQNCMHFLWGWAAFRRPLQKTA